MENKYSGMTVNERLYISGLINKFDDAVKRKDIKEIISILERVEIIDEESINLILKKIGITIKKK